MTRNLKRWKKNVWSKLKWMNSEFVTSNFNRMWFRLKSIKRFFFENDDDSLKKNFRRQRFQILRSSIWMILNLRRWNVFDDNRSLHRERCRIFRCRHNIKYDREINLINWHDIENDCNDIEISKYRSFFTRDFRWLWQNQKIHWFDFRENRENFYAKINNETHREFAWCRIIRIDKNYSCVKTFCKNSIFCHRVCQTIWRFWCFVDSKKLNFFRHILLFFNICWFESLYVFESSLRDFLHNWKCFASCR